MKIEKYYFYVYATGHGYPSHQIIHVGYSQQSKSYDDYPTWFSETPVTLEQAHEIDRIVSHYNGSTWTMSAERQVRDLINKYIEEVKK